MTISNSFNFELNRDQVIKGALRILGVISQGQTPDTDQINDASEALNVLVKAWGAEGMPLWAIKEGTINPISGTASYALTSEEPLKIYQAWYRNTTSGIDVPMVGLVEHDYERLSNKSQQGTSVQYFYKRLNGSDFVVPFAVSARKLL